MLLLVLLVVIAVFVLLFGVRFGGARRAQLLQRWPALALAVAALFAASRGGVWPALTLGALAAAAWLLWPAITRRLRKYDAAAAAEAESSSADPADAAARALLGVGPHATESEIRRAYRAKMARAHPDRGGAHNEAARLTAARDRLLRRRKG
ncbi:MAG TPA: J domain-containing protein [Vitreimonas sp.]|uniref:J domain-containing protein n=1 Tax=Vitreimonas sp. TaxID=3069702 RepID=UPI002D7511F1|nr:J domain-containing protein [Vitreimonas sp.]HYD87937.1 J domain-containing protein [Vitreimonas sp.]